MPHSPFGDFQIRSVHPSKEERNASREMITRTHSTSKSLTKKPSRKRNERFTMTYIIYFTSFKNTDMDTIKYYQAYSYALPFPIGIALTSAFSPALDRLSGGLFKFLLTSAGADPPRTIVSSFSAGAFPLFLPSLFLSFSGRRGHSSTIFLAISSAGSVVSESKNSQLQHRKYGIAQSNEEEHVQNISHNHMSIELCGLPYSLVNFFRSRD